VGTVVAMMLPYTAILYVVWTVLLIVWYLFGIPLGI
jgi:aminobenzoyl-glutamate transport protein